MLEIKTYNKQYFETEIKTIYDTRFEYNGGKCWLFGKEIKFEDEKENAIFQGHCHLTGKFRGLVLRKKLNT